MFRRSVLMLIVGIVFGISTSAFADTATQKVTTGGRFILRTHLGKVVTDQDFSGKFMLVYFGYTYCPDVCPTSLLVMTQALNLIKKDAEYIQPLFITVDPQRDTMSVMKDYVGAFHPNMIGLTGSDASIKSVVKKYRVVVEKHSEDGADKDDYSMDHTAAIFLMAPDGTYLQRFPYNTTGKQMAEKLSQLVSQLKAKP